MNNDEVGAAVKTLLEALQQSEHPEVDGTPERVAEMWRSNLLSGYESTAEAALSDQISDDSVCVLTMRRIPFHGVCPHHLVPFFGEVSLAYEPNGKIVGLGSLERLVATLSRRLILQERLTGAIADALMEHLGAQGAACRVSARHLCFMLRGREPRETEVITHALRGSLKDAYTLLDDANHHPDAKTPERR
jgi:GTP cyclohydrolase IA